MQSLPREFVRLTAITALWAVFAPGCHIETTERHEGEAGAGEQPATTGGPQAGATGEQTQATGGTQASGGSAGAGGQTETTGGASVGGAGAASVATAGAATAGAAQTSAAGAATAGAAQTSAAGAAGADTQAAGAGGISGAGETGGSAGTTGSAGADGLDLSLCAGDTSSLSSDPNDLVELCNALPYGNESCAEGAAGDISAVETMCKYVAINGRAGVFERYYRCLNLLTANEVCSSPQLADECRNVAFLTACRVEALVPGTEAYTCTDVQAACSEGEDTVPVEVCEGVMFGLNVDGRNNAVYCFECADPVGEGETPACLDVFTECAFPAGLGDGAYPYPGDC